MRRSEPSTNGAGPERRILGVRWKIRSRQVLNGFDVLLAKSVNDNSTMTFGTRKKRGGAVYSQVVGGNTTGDRKDRATERGRRGRPPTRTERLALLWAAVPDGRSSHLR